MMAVDHNAGATLAANTPAAVANRVLIAGASGFLGQALCRHLAQAGHAVTRLVRREPRAGAAEIAWDPANQRLDPAALEGYDAVINLAGVSVAGRWTPAYRQAIHLSRVGSTSLLSSTLAGLRHPPRLFLSASATGYYGSRGAEQLTEGSPAGAGFLAEVCQAWEAACAPAREAGVRVACLRTAVVLDPFGGALARLLPVFRAGLGGVLGDGHQYFPWISRPDFVRAVEFLLHTAQASGPVNLCAPQAVTNREFTQALARVLHRPARLAVPVWVLRAVLSDGADETLLASQRVVPRALLELGFEFNHPTLERALAALLSASTE